MKDQIFESYAQSINEIKEMKAVEQKLENRISLGEEFEEALINIHESDTLYLEGDSTDNVLVLQPNVNSNVFESVQAAAYDFLTVQEAFDDTASDAEENGDPEDEGTAEDGEMFPEVQPGNPDEAQEVKESLMEATDENPEDKDEVQGDPEDNGTADEDERHPHMKPQTESDESDEDKEEAPSEEVEEEDKEEVKEALIEMLDANSYVIRKGMGEAGWVIENGNPYFNVIQEAILVQLQAVCEAFDESDMFEAFVEGLSEQNLNMGLLEASLLEKDKLYKRVWTAAQQKAKQSRDFVMKKARQAGKGIKSGAEYVGSKVAKGAKYAKSGAITAGKHVMKHKLPYAGGTVAVGSLAYGAKKLSDRKKKSK